MSCTQVISAVCTPNSQHRNTRRQARSKMAVANHKLFSYTECDNSCLRKEVTRHKSSLSPVIIAIRNAVYTALLPLFSRKIVVILTNQARSASAKLSSNILTLRWSGNRKRKARLRISGNGAYGHRQREEKDLSSL